MDIKLSHVGYGVFSMFGLPQFMGFLVAVSPLSRYVVFLIGCIVVCILGLGLLNFNGYVSKGYGFNRKTFISGMLPSFVLLAIFGVNVFMGVFLGVR